MARARGFTMIELLVSASVLIVLLGILFHVLSSIRASQRNKRTAAAVEVTISQAIEAYCADYSVYPMADPSTDLLSGNRNRGNRALVYWLKEGDAAGRKGAPYLPSAYRDDTGQVKGEMLLDEWDRPFIYFDTTCMEKDYTQPYDIEGTQAVAPAMVADGASYYNFSRFQLWSVGSNGRNDSGLNLHTKAADDIANFVVAD